MMVSAYTQESAPVEYEAEQEVSIEEPKTVLIEVKIDWNQDRIIQEIVETFPEDPQTALAIAKCESGLNPNAVGPTNDFGLMQIHSPSWNNAAISLGLDEYKTDPIQNLQMARYIYDNAGKQFTDWVCFTKGMI